MPNRKSRPDPGTILGRLKQDVADIRKHFAGRGARVRQDHYDQIVDEAELGRRRNNQSTDSNN